MKIRVLLAVLLAGILVVSGCGKHKKIKDELDYNRPLPPGQDALRKITNPEDIPDFTMACIDLKNLNEAVGNSINYMRKPSSKAFFPSNGISHEHALKSLEAFKKLLDSGTSGAALNQAIRDKFDVYISVGCDDAGTMLYTGYYTPIFDGSLEQTGEYQYPLYKQPPDLVKGANGDIIGRKLSGGQVGMYPPRSEIESSGMLKGQELIWMKDPFEAYVAHVQGSAKIRLPDGSLKGVAYAANNGHEYKSVGKQMLNDGVIDKSQLSLSSMIAYFKAHRDQVSKYLGINPRFVFFNLDDGEPRGSINEPVIPMRSIATDKAIFPRASVTFIQTTLPSDFGGNIENQIFSGFACDQDTGGAIRAAGRCDIYIGQGDKAGKIAGSTYQEGKLYYLFLKK